MATLNLVAVVILLFDEIICSTTLTLQIFTQIELMFPNSFTLSKQSKRISVLQDRNDITIHLQKQGCVGFYLDHIAFPIHILFLYPYHIRLK